MRIVKNKPVGTQRVWAHLNYGSRDSRTGFQWIDWPEYSQEDQARGDRISLAIRASKLTLRQASEILGLSVVDVSSLRDGRARFESDAAEAEALELLRKGKAP